MTRFLLTTWQGGGNVPPELGLARQLVDAGHQVRVLSEPTVEEDARAVGCSFTRWPTAPSIASLDRDTALIKDWKVRNPIGLMRQMGDDVLFGPAGRFARDLLDTLDRHGADALLVDVAQFGALIGAERSGLPTLGLLPSIYVRPTPGHPVMGSGWLPARGRVGAARDILAPYVFARVLRRRPTPAQHHPRRARPAAHHRRVRVVGSMPSPAGDDQPVVRPTAQAAARQRALPGADDRRSTVGRAMDRAVATGRSTVRPRGDELDLPGPRRASSPHRALARRAARARPRDPRAWPATRRGARDGERLGCRSAPHAPVLSHADVVITHAGHGSVIKALAAGVPLVCIPHGRDQRDNTARVVAAGAGLRLSRRASATAIWDAVHRLLTEPSYRANAEWLAEAFGAEARRSPDAVGQVAEALQPQPVTRVAGGRRCELRRYWPFGGMFWLWRNRFSGSHSSLSACRRANFSGPNAASTLPWPSSPMKLR